MVRVNTMTTSLIPGRDLSYADLTGGISSGALGDEVRATWSATSRFAQAIGIEAMKSSGSSVRSKSTGELVEEILGRLPEVITEAALLDLITTSADELEGRRRKVTYEVRRLRSATEARNGGLVWKLVNTKDAALPAEEARDALLADGVTAIVVRVVESWEWDLI